MDYINGRLVGVGAVRVPDDDAVRAVQYGIGIYTRVWYQVIMLWSPFRL